MSYIIKTLNTTETLYLKHDQGKDRSSLSKELTIFVNKATAERKLTQLLDHYRDMKREYFVVEELK